MRLFFWRKPQGDEVKHAKPEPLVESLETRLLSDDFTVKLKAIREAGDKKDPKAIPALLRLVAERDCLIGEAIEVIPLIILYNPGNQEILGMVPELEKRFNPEVPSDEVWIFSAITAANPGMFSGLVPMLLKMLENYSGDGETLAVKDVVLCLGNIGDKSAIAPLEALLSSGPDDPELRSMIGDSIKRLQKSKAFVN